MQAKISKWWNSLAIRLPKSLIREVDFVENVKIDISLEWEKIVLQKEKNSLDNLLQKVSRDNLHWETNTWVLWKEIF